MPYNTLAEWSFMKFSNTKKRNDIILIICILLISLIFFAAYKLYFNKSGKFVTVKIEGKVTAYYPIDTDKTVTIKGVNGGKNILKISEGTANMIEADCPDQTCVKKHSIKYEGETIVCLPHKVVISIDNSANTDDDAPDAVVK